MSLLTADQELCQRDGICAEVCPTAIIEFKDKDAFPTLVDGGEKLCIRCGHCVAVCPHGARFAPSGHNLQPVKWLVVYETDEVLRMTELVIDWMRHLIKEDSPLAATMNLNRIVSFWESGNDLICRNAPHIIVAYAQKDDRTAPAACTIALTYLTLAAPSFDLGTCWAGYFNTAATFWGPMQQELGLPEGNINFGAMMVGYPKFKYQRMPLRNEAEITWR
ncbi:MAG: nitroreductase family protein [Desulfobacterales bacterium]